MRFERRAQGWIDKQNHARCAGIPGIWPARDNIVISVYATPSLAAPALSRASPHFFEKV
jgi:hypothetical protein